MKPLLIVARFVSIGFLVGATVGCGTRHPATTPSSGGTKAHVTGGGGYTYPAQHPTLPTAIKGPGAVLSAPNIVPVFYQDDPSIHDAEAFFARLAASSYWPGVTAEYGVGPLTVAPSVVVSDPPPATLSSAEVAAWLNKQIAASQATPPSANNIYALVFPAGMTVMLDGDDVCASALGYHDFALVPDGTADLRVPYVVVPRCPLGLDKPDTPRDFDELTSVLSHELVEAATDPLPDFASAYSDVDIEHVAWQFADNGGEVGDLCEGRPWSFYRDASVGAVVQRIWSNRAAAGGGDPCVPGLQDGSAYFNSALVPTDDVPVIQGRTLITRGVRVPVGESRTVDVQRVGGPKELLDLRDRALGFARYFDPGSPSSRGRITSARW
jgi:hypothetical protein